MKIGILTFVNTVNYGAALQSYALQKIFEREGHECEIIDYTCARIDSIHNPRKAARLPGIKILFYPFLLASLQKNYNLFMHFKKDYCKFSTPYTRATIAAVAEKYDRIVVGSDQIWNAVITMDDRSFLLDFLKDNRKKYSYAASIGTSYFTKYIEEYEALVNQFQVISIREKGTAALLKKNIGREDIHVDVDPTLLNYANWNSFITSSNPYGKYILLYFLPKNNAVLEPVRRFAKAHDCKLIHLTRSMKRVSGIRTINFASPEDFLNLIAHAQYVISGSFHALCFSLIFHKDFFVLSSPIGERNGRLTDMLSTLGLENRFVMQPDYKFTSDMIDYNAVDQKLDAEIKRSMGTIEKICGITGE